MLKAYVPQFLLPNKTCLTSNRGKKCTSNAKKERKQKREKAIIKNLTQMLDINTKFKKTRINRLLALLGKVNNMKKHIYYEVTLRKN